MSSTEEGSIATEDLLDLLDYERQVRVAADHAFRVFTSAGDLSFDEEIDAGHVLLRALHALHLMDGDPRSLKDVFDAICEADAFDRSDLDIVLALRSAVMAALELTCPVDDTTTKEEAA